MGLDLAAMWVNKNIMSTVKMTREEALRRWNASKGIKRKMSERLEQLVRNSYWERFGKEPDGIEIW